MMPQKHTALAMMNAFPMPDLSPPGARFTLHCKAGLWVPLERNLIIPFVCPTTVVGAAGIARFDIVAPGQEHRGQLPTQDDHTVARSALPSLPHRDTFGVRLGVGRTAASAAARSGIADWTYRSGSASTATVVAATTTAARFCAYALAARTANTEYAGTPGWAVRGTADATCAALALRTTAATTAIKAVTWRLAAFPRTADKAATKTALFLFEALSATAASDHNAIA
jgi:hypothetical protein